MTRASSAFLIKNIIQRFLLIGVLLSVPVFGDRLTWEQISFYEQNGYLLIKKQFTRNEIERIAEKADQAIAQAQGIAVQQDYQKNEIKIMNNGTQFVFDGHNRAIKRIVWVGSAYPGLLDVGSDEALLTPVRQLLKETTLDHLINQLHPKLPGDGVEFVFHRDIENRRSYDAQWAGKAMHNGGFVQTLLAIDPVNQANGGIEVYPGSHGSSDALKGNKDQEACRRMLEKNYGAPVFPSLQSGDVLFFHPNVAHRSLPNISGDSRRVLINGYTAQNANHKSYPGKGSGRKLYENPVD